ncbi:hypothetical protein [Frisingicoccus sp.]|uniref:hypothetical protein n=1 Tax=Frisingicoccus sp. TaxID=1918627 RepID=UPI002A832C42|nr:hypothetical protein [Frisingicoccus sp.]MDY4922129.1 hypothetical protein [Frisingicoccus sp.]
MKKARKFLVSMALVLVLVSKNNALAREFDTSLIKKVPQSLIIGLFFCQLFYFTI